MDTTEPAVATPPKAEKLTLTPIEAAHLMGCSRESVYRLLARNILPHVPGIRHKLISRAALEKFVNGSAA